MSASRNRTGLTLSLMLSGLLLGAETAAQPVPIQIGDTVSGQIAVPGEQDVYEFGATAGQVVFVDRTAPPSQTVLNWRLEDRFGRILDSDLSALNDLGPVALMGGTYTLTVLGETGQTGTYDFVVRDVLDGGPTAISIGQPVSGAIGSPGQKQVYTFSAAAQQKILLDQTATSNQSDLNWILADAYGREILPRTGNLLDAGPFTLVGGGYTLTVLGEVDATGTYDFVVADQGSGSFTPSGTSIQIGVVVPGSIDTPGEIDDYTFTAGAGEKIYFDLQTGAASLRWTLLDPAGVPVFFDQRAHVPTADDLGPFPLAQGTYTLSFEANGGNTPSYQFQLFSAVDESSSIGVNQTVSGTINGPGGTAAITFPAVDGHVVLFDLLTGSPLLGWSLVDPVGVSLFFDERAFVPTADDQGPMVLAQGTYTLVLDPRFAEVSSYELEIDALEPPPPPQCPPGAEAEAERCDGTDNDCDGQVDEDDLGNWDIYQNGVLLGAASPMAMAQPVADFYRYGSPKGTSYNGPTLPLVSQESLLFIHRNTISDALSLLIVHDKPPNLDGGLADFTLSGLGPGAFTAQADDPGEVDNGDFDGNGNAAFSWDWDNCCTDGIAIGGIDWAGAGCITVTPDFIEGIDAWSFLSGEVTSPDRIPLDPNAPVQICPSTCSLCPPPASSDGQAPRPVDLVPAGGSVFPPGTEAVLSGRVPAFRLRPLSAVLVNGQPVDSLDAAGRFFKRVSIASGQNVFTVEVLDRCARSEESLTLVGSADAQQGFDLLTDVTLQVQSVYSGTTFNEAADTLLVDAQARNTGPTILDGPLLLAFGADLAASVGVLHAAGVTPEGEPYAIMVPEGEALDPNALGPAAGFAFDNPARLPVRYAERWLAPANRPPRFTSAPPTEALVSRLYSYSAAAADPDGHLLSFALLAGPQGMTLGAQTGLLQWTPPAADEGLHEVALEASDGRGGRAEQRYHLAVGQPGPNRPPFFTTAPVTHAPIGAAYSYDAEAVDLDGNTPTYELLQGPGGMTVDPVSGLVNWPFTLPGPNNVHLRAVDGQGGAAAQEWELTVGEPPSNPSAPLISSVPQTLAAVGQRYVYQPVVSDPDGDLLTFTLPVSPTGMDLDGQTGRLDWTPGSTQLGNRDVLLRVSDGPGGQAEQAFTILVVADPPNRPPVFESVPSLYALAGVDYVYQAVAADPELDPVTYSLPAGPAGAGIETGTGRLTWTPAQQDAGTVAIGVAAKDPAFATSSQVYQLQVRAQNAPPVFGSQPPTGAVAGQIYRYAAQATDADADVPRFELVAGPSGLTIHPTTGMVLWTPGTADAGLHPITIAVTDLYGGRTEQDWDLTVTPDAQTPLVQITIAQPEPFCLAQPVEVCVDASDDAGVAQRTLSADSMPLSLDLRGCATLQKLTPQTVALDATATDPSGNQGTDGRDVLFVDCDDPNAPEAEIVSPAPGSVVTAPVDIVATITDNTPAILSWEVKIAPLDSDEFEVIGSGTGEITAGVVATFDPTRLPNDVYRVQILGNDGSQTGGIELQLGVAGDYKPGRFTMSFTDLAVPVAGIPLAVTRRYDSLDTTPGDFGPGWQLGLSGAAADSAAESRTGNPFVDQLGNEAFTRTTRVYLTRPDGRRVGFTFDPASTGFPAPMYLRAAFRPDPGVEDTLELAAGEPDLVLDFSGRFFNLFVPFNPRRYVLITKTRVRYTYDEDAGLQHVEDANGNTIDVTPGGLFSSTGVALLFERDGQGRITKITEPDDPNDMDPPGELHYTYAAADGDLTVFRNQAGEEVRYFYEDPNLPHYLSKVEDPLGRPVVRTVFDEDGRIVGQCGENGDLMTLVGCLTFDYDVAVGRVQTVVDANGHRTDLFFDARGNVLTRRSFFSDSSSFELDFEYDARDRLVKLIQPGSEQWTYEYDSQDNLTRITDPESRAQVYTYGECAFPETVTDPLGNVTSLTYDEACNRLSATSPLGHRTEFLYDGSGRRIERIDPTGDRWQFEHDALGHPSKVTDPAGNIATFTVNAQGELLTSVDRNGRRVDFGYDAAHRVISETWNTVPPRVVTYGYNAAGQIASLADPDSVLAFAYHPTGLVASVDTAGTPGAPQVLLQYAYDGNGNVKEVKDFVAGDPNGVVTSYGHDELDRLSSILQSGPGADDKRVDFSYDAASQLLEIRRSSDLGATVPVAASTLLYDTPGDPGRLTAIHHRDPLNAVLHDIDLVRDAAGNITQMTDAEGLHTYTYDGTGALVAATHPASGPQPDESYMYDGARNRRTSHLSVSHVYAYDLGPGGSRLLQDDGFDYQYDAEGSLTRKTDRSSDFYTTCAWDHRKRLNEVVRFDDQDAELGRTRYVYDALNRRIRIEASALTTHLAYDGQNPVLALGAGGSVTVRRLYARSLDSLFAEDRAGATRWFLSDQVGSVRDLIAENGSTLQHSVYDSFGRRVAASGPDTSNDLGFHARPFDSVTGLGHFRARDYEPSAGRFISEDPEEPYRYDFALNNPLGLTDPTGRSVLIEYACLLTSTGIAAYEFGKNIGQPLEAVYQNIANAIKGIEPPGGGDGGGAAGIAGGLNDQYGPPSPPKDPDDALPPAEAALEAFCSD